MKKCKKCGAVQSDDRSTCIDCGTLLGRALSEAEEQAVEAALDDKLEGLAERTEDFYVPLRDKIMGIVSILGIAAAIILLIFIGNENNKINRSIPDDMMVTVASGATVIAYGNESGGYNFPTARIRTLNSAGYSAVIALLSFVFSAPMLLIPKFMWFIDTLKYRIFYEWDTTPSYFAIVSRKIVTYLFFGIGIIGVLYGYYRYFF